MKASAFRTAIVILLAAFAAAALGLDTTCHRKTCERPIVRREWRTLTKVQKASYLAAVICLQKKPSKGTGTLGGAKYRFDDWQAVHIQRTDTIHFTGQFQPWHRIFLATYEKALREECGYAGAQPYWDWTLDATTLEDFVASPIFDTPLGFGGNGAYSNGTGLFVAAPFPVPGRTGGGCQLSGVFSKRNVTLGPGNSTAYNPHCMRRDLAPLFATQTLNSAVVKDALDEATFAAFDVKTQGSFAPGGQTYHPGGHLGVGGMYGEVADIYSSPGDPIFFMHHANMDRIWWVWQKMDLEKRLKDIAGPVIQFDYPFNFTGFPLAYHGPQGLQVTLDFEMDFGVLSRPMRIGDAMDIRDRALCFDYA